MHENTQAAPATPPLLWDIFCRVVDNFGDIGVCWRLSTQLAAAGQQVRLWVDDAAALSWMAPGATSGTHPGIEVRDWKQSEQSQGLEELPVADVWIETFGCEIAPEFIAACAYSARAGGQNGIKKPVWINLEYLTAEGYARRTHALPSPVMHGPAAGWIKYFFYPGFTPGTGGLLREPDVLAQQAMFDRAHWLAEQGIDWQGERLVSLFCYEPAALPELLEQLRHDPCPTRMLVTHGRATKLMKDMEQTRPQPLSDKRSMLSISYLPALSQVQFDRLLWACDINFVRGEDSVVRALWAAKPFVWHIYPQDDDAHHAKLDAFLEMLPADDSLRKFHHVWNDMSAPGEALPRLGLNLDVWQKNTTSARARLLEMDDLVCSLLRFVREKR